MSAAGTRYSRYLNSLSFHEPLPEGISVINPYPGPEVSNLVRRFCNRFYTGNHPRILILGINPGRYGAGVTGIPFTDPVNLEVRCGIPNDFQKRRELSSTFVYDFIDALGGPQSFYRDFMIGSVCPLGFLMGSKNFNYYDAPELSQSVSGFIARSLKSQAALCGYTDHVVVLGKRNAAIVAQFNATDKLFGELIVLEHPRYLMQYKRKSLDSCIQKFYSTLHRLQQLKNA